MPTLPRPADVLDRTRELAHDPVAWVNGIQLLKSVVAAVIAWVLAVRVLHLPQPFLAPWAAMLVVQATVYRTLDQGVRQVVATVTGVLVAVGVENLVGVNAGSLAATLLIGLLLGKVPFVKVDSTVIAATGLFVLTTGSDRADILRLGDTGIGIGVGLLVNLLVWPPFQDRSAVRAIRAIKNDFADLLCDIADGLRSYADADEVRTWGERTEQLGGDVERAWGLVRLSRESGRLNPRPGARKVKAVGSYGDALERVEQAIADTRSMTATIERSVTNVIAWDHRFRQRWIDLLEETGRAVAANDPDRVGRTTEALRELAHDLSTEDLPGLHWPEYGGLILNLHSVARSMAGVADGRPAAVHGMLP